MGEAPLHSRTSESPFQVQHLEPNSSGWGSLQGLQVLRSPQVIECAWCPPWPLSHPLYPEALAQPLSSSSLPLPLHPPRPGPFQDQEEEEWERLVATCRGWGSAFGAQTPFQPPSPPLTLDWHVGERRVVRGVDQHDGEVGLHGRLVKAGESLPGVGCLHLRGGHHPAGGGGNRGCSGWPAPPGTHKDLVAACSRGSTAGEGRGGRGVEERGSHLPLRNAPPGLCHGRGAQNAPCHPPSSRLLFRLPRPEQTRGQPPECQALLLCSAACLCSSSSFLLAPASLFPTW